MSGLEVLALGLGAVGGVFQAVGTAQAASSQAAGKAYEAEVADRNAIIARQQGQANAEDARRETRRRLGVIRAGFGSKGFSLSGTALDVLEDQAVEGELAASREAYEGEIAALGQNDKARLTRMEERSLRRSVLPGLVGNLAVTGARTAIGISNVV